MRTSSGRIVFAALPALLLASVGAGCATAVPRRHPDFLARYQRPRVIGLVEPQVSVFALTAAGKTEPRPAWSEKAKKAVGDAVAAELRSRGFQVPSVQVPDEAGEALREARLLYEAVQWSISQATRTRFPAAKLERFEYSVGPLGALADQCGVEAFAFVSARGQNATAGRAALMVGAASVLALGMSAGVAPPAVMVSGPRAEEFVSVAIVDRSGDLIWFHSLGAGVYDLRNPESAAELVSSIMDDLPGEAVETGWPQ